MHNNYRVGIASGTARGIVTLVVKVVDSENKILFDKVISEIHVNSGILISTGASAAKSVGDALTKTMKKLFGMTEFIEALVKV